MLLAQTEWLGGGKKGKEEEGEPGVWFQAQPPHQALTCPAGGEES